MQATHFSWGWAHSIWRIPQSSCPAYCPLRPSTPITETQTQRTIEGRKKKIISEIMKVNMKKRTGKKKKKKEKRNQEVWVLAGSEAWSLAMFNKTMETFELICRQPVTKWAQRRLCSNSTSSSGWILLWANYEGAASHPSLLHYCQISQFDGKTWGWYITSRFLGILASEETYFSYITDYW